MYIVHLFFVDKSSSKLLKMYSNPQKFIAHLL